jgi:hypothetical protein
MISGFRHDSKIVGCSRSTSTRPRNTHDYGRHGTTNLFAALKVGTGQVVGECTQTRYCAHFLAFPKSREISHSNGRSRRRTRSSPPPAPARARGGRWRSDEHGDGRLDDGGHGSDRQPADRRPIKAGPKRLTDGSIEGVTPPHDADVALRVRRWSSECPLT